MPVCQLSELWYSTQRSTPRRGDGGEGLASTIGLRDPPRGTSRHTHERMPEPVQPLVNMAVSPRRFRAREHQVSILHPQKQRAELWVLLDEDPTNTTCMSLPRCGGGTCKSGSWQQEAVLQLAQNNGLTHSTYALDSAPLLT